MPEERITFIMRLQGAREAAKGFKSTGDAVAAQSKKAERGTALWKKFGGAVKYGALGAAAGLGLFAKTAVNQASSIEESQNKLKVLLGGQSKGIIEFSKTTAAQLGISRSEALESAGTFAALFKTVGLGAKQNANYSKSLVTTTADLASFHNANPQDVQAALKSGLAGESEPLRKYGIFLTEATVKREAYRSGIAKVGKDLTEGQKIQARYNLIQKQTGKAHGDFARTSKGLANQQRILKARFNDAAGAVGKVLLPFVLKLVNGLFAAVRAVGKVVTWFKQHKTVTLALAAGLGVLAVGLGILTVIAGFNALAAMAVAAAWFLALNPVYLVIAAIALVVAAFVVLYRKVPAVRKVVDMLAKGIKTGLIAAFKWLKQAAQDAGRWIVRAFNNAKPTLRVIGAVLKWIVTAGFKVIVWAIKKLVFPAIKFFAKIVAVYFKAALAVVKTVFKVWKWLFKAGVAAIKWLINAAKNMARAVSSAFGTVKGAAKTVVKFVKDRFNDMVDFFKGLPGKIKSAASGMWEGLKGGLVAALNWIIDKFNGLFDKEIKFAGHTIFEGVHIDRIPGAAKGGTIQRPGAVVVGERGPELLSLPRAARIDPLTGPNAALAGAQEAVVHTHVHLDGKEVARSVAKHTLAKRARR